MLIIKVDWNEPQRMGMISFLLVIISRFDAPLVFRLRIEKIKKRSKIFMTGFNKDLAIGFGQKQ